jgi:uncharacterized membrane protein
LPIVRVLAGLSCLPLLALAGLVWVIGGVMTETGASEAVLSLQGSIVFLAALSFLVSAGLGLVHGFSGSRETLKVFAGFLVSSVLLGLAVVLGFSTWCTDCGSA